MAQQAQGCPLRILPMGHRARPADILIPHWDLGNQQLYISDCHIYAKFRYFNGSGCDKWIYSSGNGCAQAQF